MYSENNMENNKDLFYKLVGEAKEIKLTERERNSLISAVDAFVLKNPIKKDISIGASTNPQPIKSPFFNKDWFFAFSERSHNYYFAGAFVLLAIFGTGSALASQSSLPGDILYPIKVNVLEEVKAVFLPSTLKPEYEIHRAQTRISEVKELAEQDRLSDDIKISVAAQIDSHISTVKKNINDLKQKGDIKHVLAISTSLETALDAGQDQIESIAKDDDVVQVAFMKDIIEDKKEDVIKDREVIEDQIYVQKTNDENTFEIAKAKFESVQKNLSSIETVLAKTDVESLNVQTDIMAPLASSLEVNKNSTEDSALAVNAKAATHAKLAAPVAPPTIEELVSQAQELLIQGKERMDAGEYNEAFGIFREANYLTQVIKFRLGEIKDVGAELETLFNDTDAAVSSKNTLLKADANAVFEVEPKVE